MTSAYAAVEECARRIAAAIGARATGVQHAKVRVDGQLITDRRGFVDWFVKTGDGWRIRVAVDLPAPATAG